MTIQSQPRTAGISRFAAARKENNLGNLRESAEGLLRERGYVAVSVDDIAKGAGVTRRTFYKHFDGKLDIAMDIFVRQMEKSRRMWGSLTETDFHDADAVLAWVHRLIDYYNGNPITRMMLEVGVFEPEATERLQSIAPSLMGELGKDIPAFAFTGNAEEKERWAEAWMLVMHIMNNAFMLSAGFSLVEPDMAARLLARQLHRFIEAHDLTPAVQRRRAG
ncbi:TetR/AcrR family transcriptional regulator [Flavisphingomonas formosensis]|uniref:TetR/AcrR family transcriptional regulator n=1 Tax=Flavisphingomonas formosensis TaxID=861534 RepID=UPI0012F876F9|nr:TetR/AcrR family transcriptional regulator [Sphingomonas formosensis]